MAFSTIDLLSQAGYDTIYSGLAMGFQLDHLREPTNG